MKTISWNDISVRQGKKIFSIDQTGFTESVYIKKICQIVYPEFDIEQLHLDEFEVYKQSVLLLLAEIPSEQDLKYEFQIGNVNYGLDYDLTQMTLGQFIDLEMLFEQNEGQVWINIEQIIACVVRPINPVCVKTSDNKFSIFNSKRYKLIKEKESELINNRIKLEEYDSVSRLKRAEKILDEMTIGQVYPIILFFCAIGADFTNNLISSLQENLMMQNLHEQLVTSGKGLEKPMDGLI